MENVILAIMVAILVIFVVLVYFSIQMGVIDKAIHDCDDRNDTLNHTLTEMCDMMGEFSMRLNAHINNEYVDKASNEELQSSTKLEKYIEITSRLPYVTDPTAQKLWKFLEKYSIIDKENFNNETPTIPAYRVLDALSMINQDKIEYSEG